MADESPEQLSGSKNFNTYNRAAIAIFWHRIRQSRAKRPRPSLPTRYEMASEAKISLAAAEAHRQALGASTSIPRIFATHIAVCQTSSKMVINTRSAIEAANKPMARRWN
jgi:hypothetical protein